MKHVKDIGYLIMEEEDNLTVQEKEQHVFCENCDGYFPADPHGNPSCGCYSRSKEDYVYDPHKPLDFN